MSNHLHIAEIGDDVRSLAQSAASDDIKTDAAESASAVRELEQLAQRVATTVRQKPIVIASTVAAANTLADALRAALSGSPTPAQHGVLDAFAGLLEDEAAAAERRRT